MLYHPKNKYVWDAWYLPVGEKIHVFHLQIAPPFHFSNFEPMAHAVSTNLLDWQGMPDILTPGDECPPKENRQCWTGCALWHDNRCWLFYTMRGTESKFGDNGQAIGLATSEDSITFTRHPNNPVIAPDGKYYADENEPGAVAVDFRDAVILPAPQGGWLAYFAAQTPQTADAPSRSVIGAAKSKDLTHWVLLPPVFTAKRQAVVEVPDVFFMDGKWYLTCLTGLGYLHSFSCLTEPDNFYGTIYAVADSPFGPFVELEDNTLIGKRTQAMPLSIRSFVYNGERLGMYTDRQRVDGTNNSNFGFGVLSIPKRVRTRENRLELAYSPIVEQAVTSTRSPDWQKVFALAEKEDWGHWGRRMPQTVSVDEAGVLTYKRPYDIGILNLDLEAPGYILDADITLVDAESAGFMLLSSIFVRLEAKSGNVILMDDTAVLSEKRRGNIIPNRKYNLKAIVRKEFIEIYLDDHLVLTGAWYAQKMTTGLYAEYGTAKFANVTFRELDLSEPLTF